MTIVCLVFVTEIPKNYLKKIDKEVLNTFEITSYKKEKVLLGQDVLDKLTDDFDPESLFKLISEDRHLGYFYFGKAPSKADEFDFVILLDPEMVIKKIKILAYREDYGGEISSKRWLRQFDGASTKSSLEYGSDIIGISGATISARSMTVAVNSVLLNISKLPEGQK